MMNRINLMGRLTRDPELRTTPAGQSVCNFTIANERDFKNAEGGHDVDFIDIVAWRGVADFAGAYFKKGRLVGIDGRLQTRHWTDKDGKTVRGFEVVAESLYFADSKKEATEEGTAAPDSAAPIHAPYGNNNNDNYAISNDNELPF